jgi:hypothetical protein
MPLGLANDKLLFEFPAIHRDAVLEVTFNQTLRVPDDGRQHNLPPGLGRFPLRAVDDLCAVSCPPAWHRRGGIALPMWQSEACWIDFYSPTGFPFAVKVAAGKVNALTGLSWSDELDFEAGDYIEVPGQPWLDGFCVAKGVVRQFIAAPLGGGYTAEEQITGKAEHGGIQILARPMKAAVCEARTRAAQERQRRQMLERHLSELEHLDLMHRHRRPTPPDTQFVRERREMLERHRTEIEHLDRSHTEGRPISGRFDVQYKPGPMGSMDMGLGLGGSIRQDVQRPWQDPEVWDIDARSRCFVHLVDASAWPSLTGDAAPPPPPTAADYAREGLPWFEYYDPAPAPREGSDILAILKSVFEVGQTLGEHPLPENEGFDPPEPVVLRPRQ